MVTITLEVQNFLITASKESDPDTLKQELKSYVEEANYPPDEDLGIISNDLKATLELFECSVQRK